MIYNERAAAELVEQTRRETVAAIERALENSIRVAIRERRLLVWGEVRKVIREAVESQAVRSVTRTPDKPELPEGRKA